MTKEFILYVPSLSEVKAVRFNEEIVILRVWGEEYYLMNNSYCNNL